MDSNVINSLIGSKVATYRKKLGLSQQGLGDKIGLSRSSVFNIEKGRHQSSIPILYKLAQTFSIEVSELIPTIKEVLENDKLDSSFQQILQNSNVEESVKGKLLNIFDKKNKHA